MEDIEFNQWMKFILNEFYLHKNKFPDKILDLGCGTGTLLSEFPSEIERWGFDISEEMLNIAKFKHSDCFFERHSLTLFPVNKQFELVVCTHDAINYIRTYTELVEHFKLVYKVLKLNGYYFLDSTTEFNILKHFANKEVVEIHNDVHFHWKNEYKTETKEFHSYLTFTKMLEERLDIKTEVHIQVLYTREEIISAAESVGLVLVKQGADYKKWKVGNNDYQANFLFLKE